MSGRVSRPNQASFIELAFEMFRGDLGKKAGLIKSTFTKTFGRQRNGHDECIGTFDSFDRTTERR
jgi:hypothetical protein